MRCKRCGTYYQKYDEDTKGLCKPCNKKPFDKEKFDKKIKEVVFILETQGRLKYFSEEIEKILKNEKVIYKYYRYNVTEMLFQLELNRRKWKVKYQLRDDETGFIHDFYIKEFRLDIEIDEKHHNNKKQIERDIKKEQHYGKKYILRIPEQLIRADIFKAVDMIIYKLISEYKNKKQLQERLYNADININVYKFMNEGIRKYKIYC